MGSLSGKIERVKALKNNQGLSRLVNAGSEILGNPIYIHDMDYKLLAVTENMACDDPLCCELTNNGVYSPQTIEMYKNEYFIDAIASAESIALLTSARLKYNRLLVKILNNGHMLVACANMVASNQPFADDDALAFQVLGKKIALIMNRDETYRLYGERKQQAIITALLEGSIADKRLCSHSVAGIYQGLGNYIYVVVADSPPAGFKDILKQRQPAFKYALHNKNIIIIASADDTYLEENEDLLKLHRLAKKHQVRLGISHCFENLFELREYYKQACANLQEKQAESSGGKN